MGTGEAEQPPLRIATSDLPASPGHPSCARLNAILDEARGDPSVEGQCQGCYAPAMKRFSLAPGRHFRTLLVGYFEGMDSESRIAWRAPDSLAIRSFLRLGLDDGTPNHLTISRTRRLIDVETHRAVVSWVQERLVAVGLLKGKTIWIDATTLEANAAMRKIAWRDTGETYDAFLTCLAEASGIKTPTREALARSDGRRKNAKSITDWSNPHEPDGKNARTKDWRTHRARKAEHAVDVETGAIVGVTLQGADQGDTSTISQTALAAADQVEAAQAHGKAPQPLEEIVVDNGCHNHQVMVDLQAVGLQSYVSEPGRGRSDWSQVPSAHAPVYANRRRTRGRQRSKVLRRARAELVGRSFAHAYDTGGMRRTHSRKRDNILKRLLVHAGGLNLGLVMRNLLGVGKPRCQQGEVSAAQTVVLCLWYAIVDLVNVSMTQQRPVSISARAATSH